MFLGWSSTAQGVGDGILARLVGPAAGPAGGKIGRSTPQLGHGYSLRRYWQPTVLVEENLTAGGPLAPVRLLDEDLVLHHDDHFHGDLIGLHCAYGGADRDSWGADSSALI